jgi:hypothetical protein
MRSEHRKRRTRRSKTMWPLSNCSNCAYRRVRADVGYSDGIVFERIEVRDRRRQSEERERETEEMCLVRFIASVCLQRSVVHFQLCSYSFWSEGERERES